MAQNLGRGRCLRLPYHPDSADLFETIRHLGWAVFLDSGRPWIGQGRYDILAASPYLRFITRGDTTEICDRANCRTSDADPLALLQRHLFPTESGVPGGLPFAGGAIGYFSYDLARRWMPISPLDGKESPLPQMVVGLYDWAVVVDHQQQASWLVSNGRDSFTEQLWPDLVARLSKPSKREEDSFRLSSEITGHLSRVEYAERFRRIQDYIHEGDCYQVNFAQRFTATIEGPPWGLYRRLRQVNAAPFSAFLDYPTGAVLSSSPERFLKLKGGRVETRPIKGTRSRSEDPAQDRLLKEGLAQSVKDKAENLMIVDLLRNDLGRVCRIGTIAVPALFEIESFARVHHLVSTVTGELQPGRDATDLLRACLPGGSITGAPKLRAMEIIDELEDTPRGVYCGSIAYIGWDGSMDSNIAIRSLVSQEGRLEFRVGGGIVADSDEQEEYQETLDKAAAIFTALGGRPKLRHESE